MSIEVWKIMQSDENVFWCNLLRIFSVNISKLRTFLNICAGFQIKKEKLQELSFKIISSKFKWQNVSKIYKALFLISFWTEWALTFINFFPHARSQKNLYTFQMKLFTTRQPGREMIRQKENENFTEPPHYMSHHTRNHCISQNYTPSSIKNQADNDCCWRGCFDPNPGTIATSSNFWKNF